jgi:hypothetical protein
MAQGSIVRNDFSVLGILSVTGITQLGLSDVAGATRTIQAIGSAGDIDIEFLSKGLGVLKTRANYAADISADEDIINLEYFQTHISTKPVSSLLQAPTPTEDQYVIAWDDTTQEFTLIDVGSGLTFESGLNKSGTIIRLGGPLLANTDITGSFNLNLGLDGDKLTTLNIRAVSTDIRGNANNRLHLTANSSFLYGGSVDSYFVINDNGEITLRDQSLTPRGLRGFADYSANVQVNDYIQKKYADDRLASQLVDVNMQSPTVADNNKVIKWDHPNQKYVLTSVGTLGGGIQWEVITSNTPAIGNKGYITDSVSKLEVLLSNDYLYQPVIIANKGIGGWKVVCDTGVTIEFVDEIINLSIESNLETDSVELLNVAPNKWRVINSIGNITFTNI